MNEGTKDEMELFFDKLQKEKYDMVLTSVYHVLEAKDVATAKVVVDRIFQKTRENIEAVYADPNPNAWLLRAVRDELRSMDRPKKWKKRKFGLGTKDNDFSC